MMFLMERYLHLSHPICTASRRDGAQRLSSTPGFAQHGTAGVAPWALWLGLRWPMPLWARGCVAVTCCHARAGNATRCWSKGGSEILVQDLINQH